MRALFALLTAAAVATQIMAIWAGPALAAGNPEAVDIPQKESGRLKALLFRPDGQGPFPAVVGLHNCTGLSNSRRRRRRALPRLGRAPRQERLRRAAARQQRLARHRQPVQRARPLAAHRPRAGGRCRCGARLAAGASLGRARPRLAARLVERRDRRALDGARAAAACGEGGSPDFRSAVALYPGCRRLSNAAWSARVPTLILIGRADDQASAATCQQMVAGARGRSARVEIHVYPGAHHDFDHPSRPLQMRTGLPSRSTAPAMCTAAPIRPPAPMR